MRNRINIFNKVGVLFRLGRLTNLLVIAGTQYLLRFCVLGPFVYPEDPDAISAISDFSILVLITLLLTVAGYVINDYFDRKIDAVNRPGDQVMDRLISPHGAIKLHMILNIIATILGFWLAWRVKSLTFGLIFPFISGMIWLYSAKYKRTLVLGNLVVSFLAAFIILIVWLFEFFWLRLHPETFVIVMPDMQWVSQIFLAYALFAFLITLISEIVRDLGDMEGDRTFGVRTLPVVAGERTARFIASGIIVLAILLLVYCQVILGRLNFMMMIMYVIITVQLPALFVLVRLLFSSSVKEYGSIGALCRIIILAGLLSMEVLYISI